MTILHRLAERVRGPKAEKKGGLSPYHKDKSKVGRERSSIGECKEHRDDKGVVRLDSGVRWNASGGNITGSWWGRASRSLVLKGAPSV